jgi:hypothetical protein
MVASNPNGSVSELPGKNGLGEDHKPPHDLYQEVAEQMDALGKIHYDLEINKDKDYYSFWLNLHQSSGSQQGGNFEKYLVDRDGYVARWFQCTVLNYDVEKTVKDAAEANGQIVNLGPGRSLKIFQEEYETVCKEIEELIAGKKSLINPNS